MRLVVLTVLVLVGGGAAVAALAQAVKPAAGFAQPYAGTPEHQQYAPFISGKGVGGNKSVRIFTNTGGRPLYAT